MRTLRRSQVHRVHDMPHRVNVWIEPQPSHTDIYVLAELITEEDARLVEQKLNQDIA